MAILHGSWVVEPTGGFLFIWAEIWRRVGPLEPNQAQPLVYPFAMSPAELLDFCQSLHQTDKLKWQGFPKPESKTKKSKSKQVSSPPKLETEKWQNLEIALPTGISASGELLAQPSLSLAEKSSEEMAVFLHPWQIQGMCLNAGEAIEFLQGLPLGNLGEESFFGGNLRFWSYVSRWSLDLRARGKFLPALQHQENSYFAVWQPLLDSGIDRERLQKFTKQMPLSCRTYQKNSAENLAINLPTPPKDLLLNFISATLDAQIRSIAESLNAPAIPVPMREFLAALGTKTGQMAANLKGIESLKTAFQNWTATIDYELAKQREFRACFALQPPENGKGNWRLNYGLQAADDPGFVVDAKIIWSRPVERLVYGGRTIEQPQETLLKGLGLASRLNAAIEPSLNEAAPVFCPLTPLQAYEFLKAGAWRFEDSGLGVILPGSLANREGWANRLGLSIKAETPKLKKTEQINLQSLLNFKWELTIGGQRISKAEFDRLVRLNSPLVEINGEWVELRPSDVKAAEVFFAGRKDQMTVSLQDALRLATGDTQTIEKLPVVNFEAAGALQDLFTNLTTNRGVEAIETPDNFKGKLRDYQARGAGWLAFLEKWGLGACLADDMGLGKTIQLIAFLLNLQQQDLLEKPILLICPTSVLGNWEREIRKFGPTLKAMQYHGNNRPKGSAFAKAVKGKNLVITSYPLVQRDLKDLQSVKWQGIVLDEAQNIKNAESKQSQAVREIESDFRIALTGTPVENRLSELWAIMEFLNPGYLGAKNFFQRRFAIPIEKYGDSASLQTLRSLVQPFILRRLKTDRDIIQDLPEKQENNIFCGLSEEQASLYQNSVEQSLAEIEAAEGIQRRGMILALLVKLKQICNHPILFTKTGTLNPQQSGKILRLQEMLEEVLAEKERALIFTQFAEWGKLLKPYLEQQLGREVLFLYGSTSKQQREEMVDRFQQDPQGPPIMILSLKAGGTGLNLTRANHVFHFDRWWNPAVENQATDRVFRIGQTRNVQVHKFVCTGTLEEKIHDMIESKKALAEQVIGDGENWLTELDTDQLRNLLLLDRNAIIDEDK